MATLKPSGQTLRSTDPRHARMRQMKPMSQGGSTSMTSMAGTNTSMTSMAGTGNMRTMNGSAMNNVQRMQPKMTSPKGAAPKRNNLPHPSTYNAQTIAEREKLQNWKQTMSRTRTQGATGGIGSSGLVGENNVTSRPGTVGLNEWILRDDLTGEGFQI